jgi:hypothetical protein
MRVIVGLLSDTSAKANDGIALIIIEPVILIICIFYHAAQQ